MRALVISRGYPTSQDPENGIFEFEHALALAKQGVKVSYIYVDRRVRVKRGVKRSIGLRFHKHENLEIYGGYLPSVPFRFFPRLANWIYKKRYLRAANRIIAEYGKPDVIQSHYLFNLPCAIAIKHKYGIPVVATEHWSQIVDSTNNDAVKLYSESYKDVDGVVSVSNSLKAALETKFAVKSSVIFNLVSDEFEVAESLHHKEQGKLRFVSIGSLCQRKGFDILIETFSEFRKKFDKDWSLTIIGEGALKQDLTELIDKYHMADNVKLVGRKNRDEIREYLFNSDVFVLATRSETFGVVFIEAMSCGLPVIATICGGPEEFVIPEVGRLIPTESHSDLLSALLELSETYQDYDPEFINKYCRENFSSEVIIPKYIHLYESVVRGL